MITQDKWLNLNEEFLVLFVISLSFKEKNWVSNGPNDISALGQQIISWREKNVHFWPFLSLFFQCRRVASAEATSYSRQVSHQDKEDFTNSSWERPGGSSGQGHRTCKLMVGDFFLRLKFLMVYLLHLLVFNIVSSEAGILGANRFRVTFAGWLLNYVRTWEQLRKAPWVCLGNWR